MTPTKRADFRAALETLRSEMRDAGFARIEPNRQDDATVGVADEDAQALSEMMQTLSSTRNRAQAELLGLIGRAIRKLDDTPDEYGVCEECEESIAEARLGLAPYAKFCAECQQAHDPKRGMARKKITDYR